MKIEKALEVYGLNKFCDKLQGEVTNKLYNESTVRQLLTIDFLEKEKFYNNENVPRYEIGLIKDKYTSFIDETIFNEYKPKWTQASTTDVPINNFLFQHMLSCFAGSTTNDVFEFIYNQINNFENSMFFSLVNYFLYKNKNFTYTSNLDESLSLNNANYIWTHKQNRWFAGDPKTISLYGKTINMFYDDCFYLKDRLFLFKKQEYVGVMPIRRELDLNIKNNILNINFNMGMCVVNGTDNVRGIIVK